MYNKFDIHYRLLIERIVCVKEKVENGGSYSTHGFKRNLLEDMVGKSEELRPFEST